MSPTPSIPTADLNPSGGDLRASLLSPCRLLSRQPILDAQGRLYGYELLLRPDPSDSCHPELATREALDHWLMLVPERDQRCVLIPCTPMAVTDGLVTLLPADNVVLEIGPPSDPPSGLLSACLDLKQQGYRFAIQLPDSAPSPFIQMADFICFDFQALDFDHRRALYATASGSSAPLLARNLATDIQMRIALSEGCSLFQGYFFSQPALVPSRPVPHSHLVCLRLLGALHEMPSDLRKVEKLISSDASLCYRVLRLANSAIQGHASPVTTVREALLLIGEDAIRKMAIVAVAGALAANRSGTLVSLALSRAHFFERLAPVLGELPPRMYLLGMVSILDVLLENPMSRILPTLPISTEMKAALGGDDSGPGRALLLVRSLESCDWQRCQETRRLLGLEENFVASAYVEALREASAVVRELFSPA